MECFDGNLIAWMRVQGFVIVKCRRWSLLKTWRLRLTSVWWPLFISRTALIGIGEAGGTQCKMDTLLECCWPHHLYYYELMVFWAVFNPFTVVVCFSVSRVLQVKVFCFTNVHVGLRNWQLVTIWKLLLSTDICSCLKVVMLRGRE